MDKLIEELLKIEGTVKSSLSILDEEYVTIARHIEDEKKRRINEINQETDMTIQALTQEAEIATQARLSEIERDLNEKIARLKHIFNTNATQWREEWVDCILHGRS